MKRTATVAALTVAAVVGLAGTSGAATLPTSGTGWKLTKDLGVVAISPTKTYTITYQSQAVKDFYAPLISRAVAQINAETTVTVKVGGIEPMTPDACGPLYHVQVMERKNPMGDAHPGWSHGVPCPYQPKQEDRGGLVTMNSSYRDGSWTISKTQLQNTAAHEMLHALGLDHPNYDKDKDGIVESGECVATSYGNKPIMCSPNGGYSTTTNVGKLVGYDITGLKQLAKNAAPLGIK